MVSEINVSDGQGQIRSIFLFKELTHESKSGAVDTKLRLDDLHGATPAKLRLDDLHGPTPAYRTADIVVFNTGHRWTHSKTSRGFCVIAKSEHFISFHVQLSNMTLRTCF